jgi:hypothetical protein
VPARSSGKGRFSGGRAFGSGEGKDMKSGARREVERVLLRSYTILNFDIGLGRAAFGEISMLIWSSRREREIGRIAEE